MHRILLLLTFLIPQSKAQDFEEMQMYHKIAMNFGISDADMQDLASKTGMPNHRTEINAAFASKDISTMSREAVVDTFVQAGIDRMELEYQLSLKGVYVEPEQNPDPMMGMPESGSDHAYPDPMDPMGMPDTGNNHGYPDSYAMGENTGGDQPDPKPDPQSETGDSPQVEQQQMSGGNNTDSSDTETQSESEKKPVEIKKGGSGSNLKGKSSLCLILAIFVMKY